MPEDRPGERERVLGRRRPGPESSPAPSSDAAAAARTAARARAARTRRTRSAPRACARTGCTANGHDDRRRCRPTSAVAVPSPGRQRSASQRISSSRSRRRQHAAEQAERPDQRRLRGEQRLDAHGALGVVAVGVHVEAAVGPLPRPALARACRRRRARARRPPTALSTFVRRHQQRRQPGRLDGEEVAVRPRLVARLPVVGVDLRRAVAERLDEREVRRLRPADATA